MTEKREKLFSNIEKISFQLFVIAAFAAVFFFSARHCHFYWDFWKDTEVAFTNKGLKISIPVFIITGLIWIISFAASRAYKRIELWYIYPVILFVIHMILGYFMIGTYQLDDGLLYYNDLKIIMQYPTIVKFQGIKLCGHWAHGYILATLIGQFLFDDFDFGFQISHVVMISLASVAIFGIMKRMLPKTKNWIIFIASLAVSVQPMFLGLSTLCNLEFGITVFFLYAMFFYVRKDYILMAFSLFLLGTTKETGTMMALALFGIAVMATIIKKVNSIGIKVLWSKRKPWHFVAAGIIVAMLIALAIAALNLKAWGGRPIKELLTFNGEGRMTFTFATDHFFVKIRQMYILNFAWLWTLIIIGCTIMYATSKKIRDNKIMDGGIFGVLVANYAVYAIFLLFYGESFQPRYNMLDDMLLLMFAMTLAIRTFNKTAMLVPVISVSALLAFIESFVTVDPFTRMAFTTSHTNRVPMVWALKTKSELPEMLDNLGDFGYYNYQYTFIDKAIDKILEKENWNSDYKFVSSFESCEEQFYYDNLYWNPSKKRRTYTRTDECSYVGIMRYTGMVRDGYFPNKCFLFESPWCLNHTEEALKVLSEYYNISEEKEMVINISGSVKYYILEKK